MAKTSSMFECTACGTRYPKPMGKCGTCGAFGTIEEVRDRDLKRTGSAYALSQYQEPVPLDDVEVRDTERTATGLVELDRVLGGGVVPGMVVLLGGEPGIGKSTLLLDVAARAARGRAQAGAARRVLYVSGEESAAQVRARAVRIEAMAATLYLASETDLATVLGQIDQVVPELVVVDSVQTIASAEVDGAAGNVSQVREVAAALMDGKTSKAIGRDQGISHRTVEIYRARLMRKYGAGTAAELVHRLMAG